MNISKQGYEWCRGGGLIDCERKTERRVQLGHRIYNTDNDTIPKVVYAENHHLNSKQNAQETRNQIQNKVRSYTIIIKENWILAKNVHNELKNQNEFKSIEISIKQDVFNAFNRCYMLFYFKY